MCYGDTGSEVEAEGNGPLHCSRPLFTGRSSFHPGEPRDGLAGLPAGLVSSSCHVLLILKDSILSWGWIYLLGPQIDFHYSLHQKQDRNPTYGGLQLPRCFSFPAGGAGPLVICSDCYDNANIYSRTREYCPYTYLGEDDPLDKTLPGLKDTFNEHAQHQDAALESFISNHNPSVFLSSHEKRLSSHTPPEHQANGEKFHFYLWEQEDDTILSLPCSCFRLMLKSFAVK